jgi:hypothetical protein
MIKHLYILICLFSLPLLAVVPQHDIPIERYQEFGKQSQFKPVGFLKSKNGGCTATLIDRFTILTSAHCLGIDRVGPDFDSTDFVFFAPDFSGEIHATLGARLLVPKLSRVLENNVPAVQDLAVLYLLEPLTAIEPAKISLQDPRTELDQSVEFAGFGRTEAVRIEEEFPAKLGGKSRIHHYDESGLLLGYFQYFPDQREPLNANPAEGDTGAPFFVKDADLSRRLIGVHSSGDQRVVRERYDGKVQYGSSWETTAIYPHLNFLQKAMAFKEAETTANTHLWSDFESWNNSALKSPAVEAINDAIIQDELGMLLRRYRAVVRHDVTMDTDIRVTDLQVLKGHLHTEGRHLQTSTANVNQGTLHFVLRGEVAGHVYAERKMVFKNATIQVNFESLPVATTNGALDADRIDLDIPTRCCGFIWNCFASALDFVSTQMGRGDVHQWTICTSNQIEGAPTIQLNNIPAGYVAWSEVNDKRVIVKLTKKS